jgi:hypothetical protein
MFETHIFVSMVDYLLCTCLDVILHSGPRCDAPFRESGMEIISEARAAYYGEHPCAVVGRTSENQIHLIGVYFSQEYRCKDMT